MHLLTPSPRPNSSSSIESSSLADELKFVEAATGAGRSLKKNRSAMILKKHSAHTKIGIRVQMLSLSLNTTFLQGCGVNLDALQVEGLSVLAQMMISCFL